MGGSQAWRNANYFAPSKQSTSSLEKKYLVIKEIQRGQYAKMFKKKLKLVTFQMMPSWFDIHFCLGIIQRNKDFVAIQFL